jgi:two-component system, OmpR family, phosphate regulon sensor histidine kinase PhoR
MRTFGTTGQSCLEKRCRSGEQLVKRLFQRDAPPARAEMSLDAERGRVLVEESREIVVVLDAEGRVVTASRRARELFDALSEGEPPPEAVLRDSLAVAYNVGEAQETLVYVRDPGDLAAYEELRAGFTASVSHELRTPLARLLALLESATLPDADQDDLIEQAQAEVRQIGELIDDVLFLSELESGRELVALGSTVALPILEEVAEALGENAARAGLTLRAEGDPQAELPLRPRMIRVIAGNLAENAIRYAGPGSTFTLAVRSGELIASDDGVGVTGDDLPRLFERFYRADRARASRGTGLGLAIVKHIANSAGGTVEAESDLGSGLTVRISFTSP